MAQAQLLIMPPIILGLAIGIYEAIIIHRDVRVPTHRFMHTLHAIFYALIAVFAVMNVEFVFSIIPQIKNIPWLGNPLVFRIAIGLITVVKIHGSSAAIKSSVGGSLGLKETWFHSLLIGALVVAAPYAWPIISPNIGLPDWMKK